MRAGGLARREMLAGGLIVLFGLAALREGWRLGVGTLSAMGPGFVPLALGVLLSVVGVAIALSRPEDDWAEPAPQRLDRRGAACILAGALAFIVLGRFAGLIAATFCSVFIAAMGDRVMSLRGALALSAGVTLFGAVLFGTILKIPIPLVVGLNL